MVRGSTALLIASMAGGALTANVTIEVGGECGACANSDSNKCYTKFGFTDSECSCANNDGAPPAHCGTQWYDWNCEKNGQNAFIDSGCTKCVGNHGGPCPSSVDLEGECGACANAESNKCYTKFGFTDSECSCANNDGAPPAHCGTQWYDWNCVKNGQNAFIDSGCTKCVGNNDGPCPSTAVSATEDAQAQSKDTPGNPCPFCHKIVNSQGVCQPCLTTAWAGTCSCGPASSDWIKADQCHECTDAPDGELAVSATEDAEAQSKDTPGNPCPFCHKIVNSQGVCQPCLTTQWAGTCSCGPGSSDWIKADQCHECTDAPDGQLAVSASEDAQVQSIDTPGNPCPFCHKIVNSQGVCQPCLTTAWAGTCSCGPASSDWIKADQCHECTDAPDGQLAVSVTEDTQAQSKDTPGNPCPFCHKIVNSQGVCQPCLTTQWAGTCSCGPGSSDWIKADQCHECTDAPDGQLAVSATEDSQAQSKDTPGNPCPFCHKIVNSQGVCQPCLTTQWAGTCSCGPGASDWIKADQCHECTSAPDTIVV